MNIADRGVQIFVPLQWPVTVGVGQRGVWLSNGGLDCTEGNQVEVASSASDVQLVIALVSYVGHFQQTLPGCSLSNGKAVAICIRLLIIFPIDSEWRSRRGSYVDTGEIMREEGCG